ncbi:MAG: glutamate racemase [Candidatus Babeliales bacterium]
MAHHKPIRRLGIFDSGIGGLSILNAVKQIDVQEIIYIADTANLPYGDKSAAAIMAASFLVVEQLLTHQVDTIIIACHTASAIALPFLQEQFPAIRFIGMIEPTITATLHATKTKTVGLLATRATINHGAYQKELLHQKGFNLYSAACPELVPLIEQQSPSAIIIQLLEHYVAPFKAVIDTLILGCTHYDLIRDTIQHIVPGIQLISAQDSISSYINAPKTIGSPKKNIYATGARPAGFDRFIAAL